MLVLFIMVFGGLGSIFLFRGFAAADKIGIINFWASDNCVFSAPPPNVEALKTAQIYANDGINLRIQALGLCGHHPAGWYLQEHAGNFFGEPKIYYPIRDGIRQAHPGYAQAPGANVMDNIRWEIEQEFKWGFDSPKIFLVNFNACPNGMSNTSSGCGCGVTAQHPAIDNYKFGFVWKSNCAGNGDKFIQTATAHELGHIFIGPEAHDTANGDSNNLMFWNSGCNTCTLNGAQKSAVLNNGKNWASPKTK